MNIACFYTNLLNAYILADLRGTTYTDSMVYNGDTINSGGENNIIVITNM